MADGSLVEKWRKEAGGNKNRRKFNYALAECKWGAQKYNGPSKPAAANGTFSSDCLPTNLVDPILKGIKHIQSVENRDVHPGFDGLVIDIVHPSLYCYEQGKTLVLGGADVYKNA